MLDPVIHKMITYVQNLEEKDLKDKVALCFSLFLVCAVRYKGCAVLKIMLL